MCLLEGLLRGVNIFDHDLQGLARAQLDNGMSNDSVRLWLSLQEIRKRDGLWRAVLKGASNSLSDRVLDVRGYRMNSDESRGHGFLLELLFEVPEGKSAANSRQLLLHLRSGLELHDAGLTYYPRQARDLREPGAL